MTDLLARAERRVRRRSNPDVSKPDVAYGRCVDETAALMRDYNRRDVTPAHAIRATGVNYPGREHWAAVEWDDDINPADALVVDLTARQFDAAAPVPWTGTLADWYDDVVDWLSDHITVEVYAPDPHDRLGIAADPHWRDRYDSRDDVNPYGDPMRAGLAAP